MDKTIISRSSTLAFGPSFYRHGLISRGDAVRTAFAQLAFRLGGGDHQRMERIRGQAGELCRGWPPTGSARMEVADGRYTGEMEFWACGEAKASRVREIAAARGYRLPDCYAYSDSITDLPMLGGVGHPRAVNPDRALRRIARERHWPVLAFGARSAGVGACAGESHRTPAQGM